MRPSLAELLDVRSDELVSFVGAGGKSTLMLRLADDLIARGDAVVVTTTTKMGLDQAGRIGPVIRSSNTRDVDAALTEFGSVMLFPKMDDHKVTGPRPAEIDEIYRSSRADHVLVEADGAKRRPFKAPEAHEPVIPAASTLVVIVMGANAVGGIIEDVSHRPHVVARLASTTTRDVLSPDAAATVVAHPEGGLKGVPGAARAVVAITHVAPGPTQAAAEEVATLVRGRPRIDRVLLIEST